MLSFERVLEAFREHLTEDTGVEVVPTRHGCTFLTWDDRRENWDTAEICLTPEALLDRLTGAVESEAKTLSDVIQETLLTTTSERQGRAIDKDAGGAGMEVKKQQGYF